MDEQIAEALDTVTAVVMTYGLSVVGALVILIIGFWFSGLAKRAVKRGLERTGKVDGTLISFLSSLVRWAVVVFTILAVLDQFGVETTSIIAVMGAAGLAIGLALQGTLSNFAAGVMLLLFRPFSSGQYVEAGGIAGTVRSVSLFSTELDTPDNVRIVVPNSKIWGEAISNYNHNPTRRMDITCGIGYDDDIEKAMGVLKGLIDDSRILQQPEPVTFVASLGDSAVNVTLRLWCNTPDYWVLKWDMTRRVKQAFDEAGLDIPYPQRTVHMVRTGTDEPAAEAAE